MCSVIIARQPGSNWPLLIGANRDEMNNRPWLPPSRHWPDQPEVIAGLDELAGGSWMGLNDFGLSACILNRYGTLGPQGDKRSRGELILETLDHAEASEAAKALSALNPEAYRPFNLIVADWKDAFWLHNDGQVIHLKPVPAGLSMITHSDLNQDHPKLNSYRPAFERSLPDIGTQEDLQLTDFRGWAELLGSTKAPADPDGSGPDDSDPENALCFCRGNGFETLCSSILALPSAELHLKGIKPLWLFAEGQPDKTEFQPVKL
ncbi:NRDE family protein [Kiloniella sp. b19]|uniref:NRDE family protein n=1 Tax=Kiloniella sp. GXU_MW_B19 TaxID=3141326 RepID=UPI0031E10A95